MPVRARRMLKGFTLLEVLIASAILAIAVAAITQAVVAGQMQTYDALHDLRANSLAEALMEEVLALPYGDPQGVVTPGPDAGEINRSLYDNADDFHGFTEASGALNDAANSLYPAPYQTFSRGVTCAYGTMTVTGFDTPVTGLTVTVTVTDAAGRQWQLTRFVQEPAAS
ncbi:MAG: prepilin-type N-terminal cleavage/methylation domain-containing protein [Phycisphaeraceae bacterium]|nr:prepilin-type N-terminal cleavage/methylation domain-containing protein [Phycisphaeraceae bacterium]